MGHVRTSRGYLRPQKSVLSKLAIFCCFWAKIGGSWLNNRGVVAKLGHREYLLDFLDYDTLSKGEGGHFLDYWGNEKEVSSLNLVNIF